MNLVIGATGSLGRRAVSWLPHTDIGGRASARDFEFAVLSGEVARCGLSVPGALGA